MLVKKYGDGEEVLVLVHGGPGGAGSLSCMAKQYAEYGKGRICVLEPWQSKKTVWGQVEELHKQITLNTNKKIYLLGHSWGAWIVTLYASKYSETLYCVILMGAGPYDAKYVPLMQERRERFFKGEQREEFDRLIKELDHTDAVDKEEIFKRLAAISHGDDYDTVEEANDCIPDGDIYHAVWPEGEKMRADGKLIEEARLIRCPIFVIHGEQDPHPVEGVTGPFDEFHIPYTLYKLPECGHSAWKEKYARESLKDIIFGKIAGHL